MVTIIAVEPQTRAKRSTTADASRKEPPAPPTSLDESKPGYPERGNAGASATGNAPVRSVSTACASVSAANFSSAADTPPAGALTPLSLVFAARLALVDFII